MGSHCPVAAVGYRAPCSLPFPVAQFAPTLPAGNTEHSNWQGRPRPSFPGADEAELPVLPGHSFPGANEAELPVRPGPSFPGPTRLSSLWNLALLVSCLPYILRVKTALRSPETSPGLLRTFKCREGAHVCNLEFSKICKGSQGCKQNQPSHPARLHSLLT